MFLLVDKPPGWTSFKVIRILRKCLGVQKIGHAGTLDPLATGLLLVACGASTRLLEYVFNYEKRYLVGAVFGLESDTYDVEGRLKVANSHFDFDQGELRRGLSMFSGDFMQTPPAFSAVKVSGRKAYSLARQGTIPTLRPRCVQVFRFEPVCFSEFRYQNVDFPRADFEVECSKGTYIRSLIHDLGACLRWGGVVCSLRRTGIGRFSIDDLRVISVDMLNQDSFNFLKEHIDDYVISWREIFQDMVMLEIDTKMRSDLLHGKPLDLVKIDCTEGRPVLAFYQDVPVAILSRCGAYLVPKKVLLAS